MDAERLERCTPTCHPRVEPDIAHAKLAIAAEILRWPCGANEPAKVQAQSLVNVIVGDPHWCITASAWWAVWELLRDGQLDEIRPEPWSFPTGYEPRTKLKATTPRLDLGVIILVATDRLSSSGREEKNQRPEGSPKLRAATANQQMLDTMNKNPESHGWSIREWCAHTGKSIATIQDTKAWHTLQKMKEIAQIESGASPKDRRRGRK